MGIKGIDLAAGLESVNNDEAIFMEILQIYYEDGVAMLKTLRQNLQYTDMKTFIIHTHAMKSASKGIGANEVSERFREMEFAGKDNDMDTIERRLDGCLALFEELLENIKKYLDGEEAGAENGEKSFVENGEESSDKTGEILGVNTEKKPQKEEINRILKEMKHSLENIETDTFEVLMDRMESYSISVGGYEPLERIRNAYEEYDFAKIIVIIDEVINN